MLHLDFTIETSDERNKLVNQFFTDNPNYKPTQSELETITNYILYGKDQDGTSVVDRGEVEIETKYKSYSKRKAESLDELIETPGFNENTIVTNYVYRHPKPAKIDRETDADVPGIKELWKSIDRIAYIIDLCNGDCEIDPAQPPVDTEAYSSTDLYKLKHHLIDMRKQQYVLRESYKGTEHNFNPNVHKGAQLADIPLDPINWDKVWFFPMGLRTIGDEKRWERPQDYEDRITVWDRHCSVDTLSDYKVIDFTNPEHIYWLTKAVQDLSVAADQEADGNCKAILATLRFYGLRANLSPARRLIWELKCLQWNNGAIRLKVNEEFGTSYNENYISTLFKQNVCTDIAAAARLHFDYFLNRADKAAWKTCNYCGERKLRDTREFMRKSKSSDGLAAKCKECEKKARDRRKAGL